MQTCIYHYTYLISWYMELFGRLKKIYCTDLCHQHFYLQPIWQVVSMGVCVAALLDKHSDSSCVHTLSHLW